MCRLIAELVGTDKRALREAVNRLELSSGLPGIDVRLASEIYGKLHMTMRALGMDPNDTTPHELYQSLLNLAALHDSFLSKKLGISSPADAASIFPAVVKAIDAMRLPKQAWILKRTTAKRLLKNHPPKGLMKLLNYRSIDSLLKREPVTTLFAVARSTEPMVWQQRFLQSYKKLKSSDFEVRDIEVCYMNNDRWKMVADTHLQQHRNAIIHSIEVGNITILPLHSALPLHGLTLTSLLLVMHYMNDIRTYSTYFKFHHMRRDFGKLLTDTIQGGSKDHARLAGQPVHWRVIHHYYGSSGSSLNHPDIFEPHLQLEDLEYRKAEQLLYQLEPALHFWKDLDYVGLPQPDGPFSFSVMDVSLNLLNRVPYERRLNYHLRDALWNELYSRYVGQQSLERQLLKHLDEQVVPESSSIPDLEFAW